MPPTRAPSAGSHRKLHVTANPNVTLTLADVPLWCRRARAYLLGPLTLHDVDAASFVAPRGACGVARQATCSLQLASAAECRNAQAQHPRFLPHLSPRPPPPPPHTSPGLLAALLYPAGSALVGLMAQGFQRGLGPKGEVLSLGAPSPQLLVSSLRRSQARAAASRQATGRRRLAGTRPRVQCLGAEPAHMCAPPHDPLLPPALLLCPTSPQSSHPQAGLGPHVTLLLSDVETEGWTPGALQSVAAATAQTLVTLGDKGADEWRPSGGSLRARRIPPFRVEAVDTNGAGDIFGTAYVIALLRGDDDPGAAAAWCARRRVHVGGGPCQPAAAASALLLSRLLARTRCSTFEHVPATHCATPFR